MRAFLGPLSLGEGKSVDLGPSAGVTGHVTAQQRGPAAPGSPPCRFGSPPFGIGALGIPCSAFPAFLAAAEFGRRLFPFSSCPRRQQGPGKVQRGLRGCPRAAGESTGGPGPPSIPIPGARSSFHLLKANLTYPDYSFAFLST